LTANEFHKDYKFLKTVQQSHKIDNLFAQPGFDFNLILSQTDKKVSPLMPKGEVCLSLPVQMQI